MEHGEVTDRQLEALLDRLDRIVQELNRLATRRSTLSWRRSRKELRWNGTPAAWKARSPKELFVPVDVREEPTNASMGPAGSETAERADREAQGQIDQAVDLSVVAGVEPGKNRTPDQG